MPVVLLLAALAILAGVVVVAVGRGGELAIFRPDASAHPQVFATAADVASYRPPPAFFGYSATATDEALQRITRVVAERDAEVAWLRDQVAQLKGDQAEAASWPQGWTYGGPGGPADEAGTSGWAGPEAYAEPERRADPADWRAHGVDAGPEPAGWSEPEPAGWSEPEPAGWSEPEPPARDEAGPEPATHEDEQAEASGWPDYGEPASSDAWPGPAEAGPDADGADRPEQP